MKAALLIIDLQEDFLPPNGKLAVSDGRTVIPVINSLFKEEFQLIVASKDFHPQNHISFASNHDHCAPFQTKQLSFTDPVTNITATQQHVLWPDHCVQNTPGVEFPPGFPPGFPPNELDHIVYKGTLPDREYYSAFQDVWGCDKTDLDLVLKSNGITDVYVVGLAFDYCVYHTSLDCQRLGYNTFIIKEATKPVDGSIGNITEKTKMLESQGISVISVNDLNLEP